MRIVAKDLLPGSTYHLQFRSKNAGEVSEWGHSHSVTIGTAASKPVAPTGVSLESIGDSFQARWNHVIMSDDGSLATDLTGYVVQFRNVNSNQTATFETTDTSFELTFNLNFAMFTPIAGQVGVKVAAKNNMGVQGDWSAEVITQNPPPGPVRNLVAEGVFDSIAAKWEPPANLEEDFKEYRVFVGTSENFTPTTPIWTGVGTSAVYYTSTQVNHWVKVIAYDKFLSASTVSTSGPVMPRSSVEVDIDAPDTPTNLDGTISGQRLTVTWTAPANPDNDLAGYQIGYRPAGQTGWSYATASHEDTSVVIEPINRFVNYETKIQAYDFSFNYSSWSTIDTVTGEVNTAPAVPTGLQVKGAITTAMVLWNANTDPDLAGYEVQFKDSPSFSGSDPIFPTTSRVISFVENVTTDTLYHARVRAVDTQGLKSNWSAVASGAVGYVDFTEINDRLDNVITDSVVQYAVSASDTVAPTTGWSTSTPTRTPGSYIWFRSVITYGDGSGSTSDPALLTGNDGAQGEQGIPGAPGDDGQSLYTWIKFADTPTTGMADVPDGKTYMGIAYNKPTQTESSNYADYQWSLIKGADGSDGKGISNTVVNYTKSTNGVTAPTTGWAATIPSTVAGEYLWTRTVTTYTDDSSSIAYGVARHGATGSSGRGITGTVVDYQKSTSGTVAPTTWQTSIPVTAPGEFLWTRTTTSYTSAPLSVVSYSVAKHGETGQQGIPGQPGADGQPTYTWIKYGTSAAGAGMSNDPTGKTYIGIAYNKDTATESDNPSDYTWSLFQGPQGPQGNQGIPGSAGSDGITHYTWLKYADTPTSGMSDTADGKSYIGLAYNKTTPTESANYSDYTWSLIRGADGADGKGISTTVVTYQTHSNGTTAPTGTWQPAPTATTVGQFLWTKTYTTYTDGTNSTAYSVSAHGATGPGGAAGRGITGTTVDYQKHTNGTTAPTGAWTTTIPSTAPGEFLWTRTTTTYSSAPTSVVSYSVAKHGETGQQGIPGPPGADGQTTYTWVKYSNSSTGTNPVDSPVGMSYIGLAFNKTTATESTTPGDYQWSLIKGPQGDQGVPGPPGEDGSDRFTWIKYADTPTTGMSDTSDGKTYMGIAYNKTTQTESTNYADYSWSLIRGADGKGISSTVVNYAKSTNGTTAPTTGWTTTIPSTVAGEYLWTRTVTTYTDSTESTAYGVARHGATGSSGRGITGTTVTYQKNTSGTVAPTTWLTTIPATSPGEFLWTKTTTSYSSAPLSVDSFSVAKHGDTGQQGIQGPPGADGTTTYTWVKYADSAAGAGMSDTPAGKTYIGLAFNKTTATESSTPGDYQWSLIQGPQGNQGIQGPPGPDGQSLYTWIKYADTPTTGMADVPTGKTYMGVAYNKTTSTESSNYADYSWSLIKGADGSDGKGISNTVVTYQTHSNGTTAPTGTWSANPTATTTGQFLWTKTETTYTDATKSTAYSVAAHGSTGAPGAAGRGITGTTVDYQASGSGTIAPTGTWTTAIPATSPGQFLWTRTTTTYSSAPSPVISYAVGKHGETGQQGIPGPPGSNGQTTYTWVKYADTAAGAGMSDSPTGKTYIGLAFNKTTATESSTATDYQWSLIQGAPGSDGISITGIQPFFRVVTKGAAAPAQPTGTANPSGWTTTEPAFTMNTELYRTERITYSNNTASWTPVTKVSSYTGIDEVNTIAITADKRVRKSNVPPVAADGVGAPVGALWYEYGAATAPGTGTVLKQTYEWTGSIWQTRGIDRTFLPAVDIGTGTFGDLHGDRMTANSIGAISIKTEEIAADQAFLNNLTVTTGHISDLTFDKITGGSGILSNVTVKSTMTLGDASTNGVIQSHGYSASTGFKIDKTGIIINQGSIAASALNIQVGQNLVPVQYGSFEFPAAAYSHLQTTFGNALIQSSGGKFGQQCLRVDSISTSSTFVYLADTSTDYNIPVEEGKQYIVSAYFKGTGSGVTTSAYIYVKGSNGVLLQSANRSITQTDLTWYRVSAVVTIPAGVTSVLLYLYTATASSSAQFDVDGVQFEEKTSASTEPSAWSPGTNMTMINGASITTGEIRSNTNVTVNGVSQPMWSINMAGGMQIGSAVIRGNLTVGATSDAAGSVIQSSNYAAGASGFMLRGSDGYADFQNVNINMIGTASKLIAGTSPTGERTEISNLGLRYFGADQNIDVPVSEFGKDMRIIDVTSGGDAQGSIYGIDNTGAMNVSAASIGLDPEIGGTPLLGTLALRTENVDLDTPLGHLDQTAFSGNNAAMSFSTSTWPWNNTSEKTVIEVMREQQAGRAVLPILSMKIRFAVEAVNNAVRIRVRKTQIDLPTASVPAKPGITSSLYGSFDELTNIAQHGLVMVQLPLHTPARSELARWLVTVINASGAADKRFRVEEAKISFIDLGPASSVGMDIVNRVVADGSVDAAPPPKKTYTSRWYANSIRRAQGGVPTSIYDRKDQALMGWMSHFNGDPFHTILGFDTATAHYGQVGENLTNALSGATIERVRLRLTHLAGNANVQALVGVQSSSTNIPTTTYPVAKSSPGQTIYHVLSSHFRSNTTGLGNPANRFITLGPGGKTQNTYASWHGRTGTAAQKVELEITYTK